MKRFLLTLLCATALLLQAQNDTFRDRIDLAGEWLFTLDRDGSVLPGQPLTETVHLPGTTDTNHKGDALHYRHQP